MQLTTDQIDSTKSLSAAANRILAAFGKSRDTTPTMHHAIVELQNRIEVFLTGLVGDLVDADFVLDAMWLVYRKFGAPGDWGYGTLQGDALKDFYKLSWPAWTKLFRLSPRCPRCRVKLANDGSCCDACGWVKEG